MEGLFSATEATSGMLFLTKGSIVARNFPRKPAEISPVPTPRTAIAATPATARPRTVSLPLEVGASRESSITARRPITPSRAIVVLSVRYECPSRGSWVPLKRKNPIVIPYESKRRGE